MIRVLHGDCRSVLREMDAETFHACVCDPPYGLEFMGKDWDAPWKDEWQSGAGFSKPGIGERKTEWPSFTGANDQFGGANPTCATCGGRARGKKKCGCAVPDWRVKGASPDRMYGRSHQMRAFQTWCEEWAREVYRVLKPGAHFVAFGGTRTWHRMAVAIEDAGFEIRDTLFFLYGSGFPKSHNLKRNPICDCNDGDNPLPYCHGEQATEYDLRLMREADLSAAKHDADKRAEAMQPSVSEQGLFEYRPARAEPQASDGKQPGVEGRKLRRAAQGISDDPKSEPSEGTSERLRSGAHLSCGTNAWSSAGGWGGSSSREPGQGGQPPGKSDDLCEPFGSLDDRALRGRGACPRCGKLKKEFEGFGTALKPSVEPIILARKPLIGTVAANVLAHGCGGLNVDGCRVEAADGYTENNVTQGVNTAQTSYSRAVARRTFEPSQSGRWPPNVLHDGSDEVLAAFGVFGEKTSGTGAVKRATAAGHQANAYGKESRAAGTSMSCIGDSGSAARFYPALPLTQDDLRFHYSGKADATDRAGSTHPTIKPLALMKWLVTLVTPPGGHILDPFAGSGTTGEAAQLLGFDATLIEQDAQYVTDIKRRLGRAHGADTPLFAEVNA